MRGLPVIGVLALAAVAIWWGLSFTKPTAPQESNFVPPPGFNQAMKQMWEKANSPEMREKQRRAVARCNLIFGAKSSVENAKQFLDNCHAERVRKDCLQAAKDWIECAVELYVPDPNPASR